MARNQSDRLLELGYELAKLGEAVEAARDKLDTLREQGYALTSPEIQGANLTFNLYSNEFIRKEAEYDTLKRTLIHGEVEGCDK